MGRKVWIHTFGVTAINTVLALITSVALARYLGPEGRGILLALVFWPGLLRRIFYLSLNEATTYHVARARVDGGRHACDEQSRAALTLHLLAVVSATLASLLLLPILLGEGRAQYLPLVLIFTAISTPLTIMDLYYNAVCQGRFDVNALNLLRLCQPVIYVAALLALLLVQSIKIETVLAAMVLSTGASVVLGVFLEGTQLPGWDLAAMRNMLHTGLRIHGANLLLYIGAEVDKLVVIQWMDDASIGVYAVALAVSLAGSGLITQSLMVLAYPKISGAADKSQQITLVCNFAQAAFLLLILINGAVALIAPWLVPMVFGVDFAAAVPVTMILLLMNTFRGARQVMDRALRATLNTRLGMLSEGVGLACFAALAPIGGSLSGLAGIAWAMAGAQLLALGFMLAGMARVYKVSVRDLLGLRWATVLYLLRQMRRELWTLQGPWSR